MPSGVDQGALRPRLVASALVAVAGVAALLVAPASGAPTSASAAPAASSVRAAVAVRLRQAVERLPRAREVRRGYAREEFPHWVDADGDCQDTRDEVLRAESRVRVSGCDITSGRWRSWYDGRVWTDAEDVDIDHLVPLSEAWDSGARRWRPRDRQRYANDLADRRPLVAVTDEVNQSKSDQDPAEWLPPRRTCRYVGQWVAVKIRWGLSVDRAEKRALRRRAGQCRDTVIRVRTVRTAG